MNKKIWSILITMILLAVSCSDLVKSEFRFKQRLSFAEIQDLNNFYVPSAGTVVIRDDSTWKAFCDSFYVARDTLGQPLPAPSVNFNTYIVVGVTYGDDCRFTGCTNNAKSIEKVQNDTNEKILVHVGSVQDLGTCTTCVAPLHLIMVNRENLPADIDVEFLGEVPTP